MNFVESSLVLSPMLCLRHFGSQSDSNAYIPLKSKKLNKKAATLSVALKKTNCRSKSKKNAAIFCVVFRIGMDDPKLERDSFGCPFLF